MPLGMLCFYVQYVQVRFGDCKLSFNNTFFNVMFNSFKIRPILRARKASDQFHVSLSISNKTD